MNIPFRRWNRTIGVLLYLWLPPSLALDLEEAYRLARQNDPSYQAVAAKTRADQENIAISRAKLLPQIGASGSARRMWVTRTIRNQSLPTYETDSWNWSVDLTQALYRPEEWASYRYAKAIAKSSRMRLRDEEENLLVRVGQIYFATLDIRSQLDVANRDISRYEKALRQVKVAFEKGEGTRTDIEEIQARLDEAKARAIDWEGQLEIAERRLSMLIGQVVNVSELEIPTNYYRVAANVLEKSSQKWLEEAKHQNTALKALQAEVEAAEHQISQAWAGHKPKIDLIASYRQSSSDSEITLGQKFKTGIVGVQASLPLFRGGGTSARVRQALEQLQESKFKLAAQSLELERRVLDAYSRIRSGFHEIRAREQALRSSRQALIATQKGYQAGIRNTIDVLNAAQKEAEAQAQYMHATYQMLQAVIELIALANQQPEDYFALLKGSQPLPRSPSQPHTRQSRSQP